jgi:hypothetical protein
MRTALFWAVTLSVVVISYRRFETTYWSLLVGSRIFLIGCPSKPVRNYHYTRGNNPEELSSQELELNCKCNAQKGGKNFSAFNIVVSG